MTPETLVALLVWGTVVGVDLVTFPQGLLSRPLVAGTGAGLIVGDPVAGVAVGAVLELFALDVLPVGAARYPDYGPGVVAAVAFAADRYWHDVLGYAVLLGLLLAVMGGRLLLGVRKANGRAIQRHAAGLAAGDPRAITQLHWQSVFRDAARSLVYSMVGVGTALLARAWLPLGRQPGLVTAVAVGTGLAAAAGGAIRGAGRGARLRWLVGGVVLGTLMVILR